MKAKYLKPIIEDTLFDTSEIMIAVSADGNTLIESGGSTTDGKVTEADSRFSIWEDDVEEDF